MNKKNVLLVKHLCIDRDLQMDVEVMQATQGCILMQNKFYVIKIIHFSSYVMNIHCFRRLSGTWN